MSQPNNSSAPRNHLETTDFLVKASVVLMAFGLGMLYDASIRPSREEVERMINASIREYNIERVLIENRSQARSNDAKRED
jgi:hypothetical protein